MTHPQPGSIVVGVDGSPYSDRAVAWAGRYAGLTGAHVTLVTAWHWPMSYGVPLALEDWDPSVDAQECIEKAAADLQLPTGRVHRLVEQGPAAQALVKVSDGAELLVVGTRGHGTLAGAVLGSVSDYCTHHAHCPVVVVR